MHLSSRIALLAAAILALAACGSTTAPAPTQPPAASTVIIGYSAPGLVGAQLDIQQSLEVHAKERGWQLITTTSDGDPQKQVEQIKNFLTLGVSAVVAVPDDSRGICEAAAAAQAAQVPFYTIDRSPEGCAITMTVLSDNHLAGRQSGEALVAFLEERYGAPQGTVLEITGDMATNVAVLRGGGFEEVLAEHPEIEVVTKVGNWQATEGPGIVREALAAYPQLDAIYMHSDAVYLPGVLETLRAEGRLVARGEAEHIFLAGVDGSAVCVQAVRDGFADQCSNQPIPDFGIVVDWIAKDLAGEVIVPGEVTRDGALWSPARITASDVGPQLFLSTTSITAANVDDPRLWANQP